MENGAASLQAIEDDFAPAAVPDRLAEFAARIGILPEGLTLLRQAFTHRSMVEGVPGEDSARADNERLEFLGDSILNLVVSSHLFDTFPVATEGQLTRMRARLVSRAMLAEAAERLDLIELIEMAPSERAAGGRERPGPRADAFEAVLGTLYLLNGLEAARAFVREHLLAHVDPVEAWDHKSRLQEFMQAKRRATPTYRIHEVVGPAHARKFIAEVIVKGSVYGRGTGRSKKDAEQAAAAAARASVDSAGRRRRRSLLTLEGAEC